MGVLADALTFIQPTLKTQSHCKHDASRCCFTQTWSHLEQKHNYIHQRTNVLCDCLIPQRLRAPKHLNKKCDLTFVWCNWQIIWLALLDDAISSNSICWSELLHLKSVVQAQFISEPLSLSACIHLHFRKSDNLQSTCSTPSLLTRTINLHFAWTVFYRMNVMNTLIFIQEEKHHLNSTEAALSHTQVKMNAGGQLIRENLNTRIPKLCDGCVDIR